MDPVLRAQCDFLFNLGIWPDLEVSQIESWLGNFHHTETAHAEALVESLIYLNDEIASRLATSAFHSLSNRVANIGSYEQRRVDWQRFRDDAYFTYVTGTQPNPTDSGHRFVRLARQAWSVDEGHVRSPGDALVDQLTKAPAPLIFVDDFCGSGQQFLDTWRMRFAVGASYVSFESASTAGLLGDVYYCLPVITSYGRQRLQTEVPELQVEAAHVLAEDYGAASDETLLFPSSLKPDRMAFIFAATSRAFGPHLPALGFHNLGLALAFENSTPDAALPILWKATDSWRALVPRR